jgi:hypothetical protein
MNDYVYSQKKIVDNIVFSMVNQSTLRITNCLIGDNESLKSFFYVHKDMRIAKNKKHIFKPKLIKIWIDENKAKKENISINEIEIKIYELLNELKVTEFC